MTPARGFQLLRANIAGVDLVAADSAHSFGRHTHDTFGIGLIERGAQKSASGRGVVEAGAGDVITIANVVNEILPRLRRVECRTLKGNYRAYLCHNFEVL